MNAGKKYVIFCRNSAMSISKCLKKNNITVSQNIIKKISQDQSKYISPCYQTGIFSCFSVDESNVLLKDRSSSGFTSAIQPTSSGLSLWHFSKQSIFALPYLFRVALSQENRMFMYVCMYVSIYLSIYLCIYVCMYACMHACMYVCVNPSGCAFSQFFFKPVYLTLPSSIPPVLNVFNHLKTTTQGITVSLEKPPKRMTLHPIWSTSKELYFCCCG